MLSQFQGRIMPQLRWFWKGGFRLAEGVLQLSSEWSAFGLDCPGEGVERVSIEWSFFGLGCNWFASDLVFEVGA